MKRPADTAAAAGPYLLLGAAAGGAGNAPPMFVTLEETLAAAGKQELGLSAEGRTAASLGRLEILCCRSGANRWARRPQYHFYVDACAEGSDGDGTEVAPWSGMARAVEELLRLHRCGDLRLGDGRRLRLSHRELFTPTSVEKWKRAKESVAKYAFMTMALLLVAPLLAILACLVVKAWPALRLSFLLENPRDHMTAGGILAPLVGTFFLVFISLLVAAPIGVLAGVYLNEYARDNWLTRIINLAVVNLAGVPSIVHALFGVGAFVLFFHMRPSMLVASCTLAVMTLPVIITSTREALASVPMSFREACWNLGASRWQTIRTLVLPNSISGILTGVILQVSRAAGETAPILFTGAVFFRTAPPRGLGDCCLALSTHLYALMTTVRGVSEAIQYGTAVVLVGLVLAVNSLSIALRVYLRARKRW